MHQIAVRMQIPESAIQVRGEAADQYADEDLIDENADPKSADNRKYFVGRPKKHVRRFVRPRRNAYRLPGTSLPVKS